MSFLLLILVVSIQSNSFNIFAQETTDPELEELKKKKEIAEAKKAIAEARKAEIEAKFPIPDPDTLKGSTDVKGDLIESRIQAYKANEIISDEIAKNTQNKGITRLFVFNETDYEKILAYKRLIQQLDVINEEYRKCSPTGGAAGPAVIPNLLLNALPLLKTDTSIVGSSFDIDDEAFWASLANKFSSRGIYLSNPFISNFDSSTIVFGNSPLFFKLEQAYQSASKPDCANNYKFKNSIDSVFRKIREELNLATKDSTPEITKKTTTTIITPPNKTEVEEIANKTASSSPSPSSNNWFNYLITEQIMKTMQTYGIYWIKVKNIKAGGNLRIKSNPLIDIFRGGSSIKFSGGSIATYYIFNNNGDIIASGVINAYTPYKKSSQIK
jgi:hypothetical protein